MHYKLRFITSGWIMRPNGSTFSQTACITFLSLMPWVTFKYSQKAKVSPSTTSLLFCIKRTRKPKGNGAQFQITTQNNFCDFISKFYYFPHDDIHIGFVILVHINSLPSIMYQTTAGLLRHCNVVKYNCSIWRFGFLLFKCNCYPETSTGLWVQSFRI